MACRMRFSFNVCSTCFSLTTWKKKENKGKKTCYILRSYVIRINQNFNYIHHHDISDNRPRLFDLLLSEICFTTSSPFQNEISLCNENNAFEMDKGSSGREHYIKWNLKCKKEGLQKFRLSLLRNKILKKYFFLHFSAMTLQYKHLYS